MVAVIMVAQEGEGRNSIWNAGTLPHQTYTRAGNFRGGSNQEKMALTERYLDSNLCGWAVVYHKCSTQ
jgi:hypothetical protein